MVGVDGTCVGERVAVAGRDVAVATGRGVVVGSNATIACGVSGIFDDRAAPDELGSGVVGTALISAAEFVGTVTIGDETVNVLKTGDCTTATPAPLPLKSNANASAAGAAQYVSTGMFASTIFTETA
jgi:hypothetical protein